MSLPTTQEDFALVRAVAGTYIEYPFIEQGDPATKIYHMICQMAQSEYSATAISLDATMATATTAGVIALPFTGDSAAYFVGDFGHAPVDGGMVEFERIFANIPATRNNQFEGTYAYSYPGIYDPDGSSSRYPKSIPTGSVVDYTYYLPGVTTGIATFSDVIETPVFTVINPFSGQEIGWLSDLTTPTVTAYLAKVTAGEYLVVASEIKQYKGNIIQRADVKVRAL